MNGNQAEVDGDPSKSLLDVLREDLYLTGTKRGCDSGECGACTILVDGQAVDSCLMFAPQLNGREIQTVEGLKNEKSLHPLQEAFLSDGAVQCGFCTPGMLMSAKALLERNPRPTREDIVEALSGNLCRCTGYVQIVEAVESAAEAAANAKSTKPEK